MEKIPVVIVHTGYKDYLRANLEVTSKKNKIYLIGDTSLSKLGGIKNVIWLNIEEYNKTEKIKEMEKNFVNYSTNPRGFELFCFLRVFIIAEFMRIFKLKRVFHSDSDNILFHDINDIIGDLECPAYHTNGNYGNSFRMSDSIHNGLITQDFIKVFSELCKKIYVKGDYSLIKDKIEYHKKVPGGICDMTFYYLMRAEEMIDVVDLNKPRNGKVFINIFKIGDGWESRKQYTMDEKTECIKVWKKGGKNMVFDQVNKKFLELVNIHFQGGCKKFLNDEWIKKNLTT